MSVLAGNCRFTYIFLTSFSLLSASSRAGRTDPRQQDSLAQLMGINGEGAGEKGKIHSIF